jgi:thiosulfate/3-mercaptopyruvate sulfurtransferase
VLADVRWYLDGRSGREAFEAGHLPGAVFVDLDVDLSAPVKGGPGGRHPLPTPDHFAAALGRLGIGSEDLVVAYDDSGGGSAGRLVVMLRSIGRPAALLDGGLTAWAGPVETGPGGTRPPLTVPAVPWPAGVLVSADEVALLAGATGVVLDARAAERYRGDLEPIDARPGHVPGARNAPWASNLDAETARFLPAATLRERYTALGVDGTTDVVCYCGSGVSACADVLAIEHAGLGAARLYVGSWSGWAADPDRPVALGDAP